MTLRLEAVLVVLLAACGQTQQQSTQPCSSTCDGCCDYSQSSQGECKAIAATACAAPGQTCRACSTGQECVAGTCDFVPDQLPTGAKYVFVTSAVFDGNLGGLAGANQKCQAAGVGANLGTTFVAWVSDFNDVSGSQARPTVNAIDRITGNGPWYLPCRDANQKLIRAFNNKAQVGATPLVTLDCSEQGQGLPTTTVAGVWTGTSAGGTAKQSSPSFSDPANNCRGWTDNGSGNFATGAAGTVNNPPSDWTDIGNVRCNGRYHLYCFGL